jgi:hypothetical protein
MSAAGLPDSNSRRVGNGQPCRGHLCFQLEASCRRALWPDQLAFPTRLELETEMSAAGLPVSNSRRVGNGQPCRLDLCFQLASSWKRKLWPDPLAFPIRLELETGVSAAGLLRTSLLATRGKLETQAGLATAFVSNSSPVGNRSVRGRVARFQLASSWKQAARPRTDLFPTRAELETQAGLAKAFVSNSPTVGNGNVRVRDTRLQHASSWKQAARARTVPLRAELKTQAGLAKAFVSKSPPVGNRDDRAWPARFQIDSSLKQAARPRTQLFTTRAELLTVSACP